MFAVLELKSRSESGSLKDGMDFERRNWLNQAEDEIVRVSRKSEIERQMK
jgi:hypothetical protein